MKNFNLISEVNKLGYNVTGECLIDKPIRYEDKEYFYTPNFHPQNLKDFILENKESIIKWCEENKRNVKSGLLGY